jgi:tRNA pseudouridine38-40 synthase
MVYFQSHRRRERESMAVLQKSPKRFAVTLEYDGSAYSGWQFQENAPTIQGEVEAAIEKCFGEKRRVGGASRTDAGVHALGQAAIFDLAYAISPRRLMAALNSALPRTIRIISAKHVAKDWDPRQKAVHKSYYYLIHNRFVDSPLWQGKAWQVFKTLNLAAMRLADFTSFRAAGCEAKIPIRTIKAVAISRRGDIITFCFTADAFLYHMVRNLVGTLVYVGLGKIKPSGLRRILKARDRKQAGPTAPAHGLYLKKIRFLKNEPRMETDKTD